MIKRHTVTTAIFAALAGVALLAGCTDLGQSPLAPEPMAAVQETGGAIRSSPGPFTIAFSPGALVRATKPAGKTSIYTDYTETATEWFSLDKKGKMHVKFKKSAADDQVQVEKATFDVKKGAISRASEITMTVHSGSELAHVMVEFTSTPTGLTFDPPATLKIVLRGDLTEEELAELVGYHDYGTGVEKIEVEYKDGKKKTTITMKVAGFSRYSLGGDGIYYEEEAEDDECLEP